MNLKILLVIFLLNLFSLKAQSDDYSMFLTQIDKELNALNSDSLKNNYLEQIIKNDIDLKKKILKIEEVNFRSQAHDSISMILLLNDILNFITLEKYVLKYGYPCDFTFSNKAKKCIINICSNQSGMYFRHRSFYMMYNGYKLKCINEEDLQNFLDLFLANDYRYRTDLSIDDKVKKAIEIMDLEKQK